MQSMNEASMTIKQASLAEEFAQILLFIQTGYERGYSAHEVECGLWQRMLKLGRDIFQAWLDRFGDGDAGDRIVLADGREVGRLEDLHRREIQNLFGAFELMRAVYGTREGQKIEAVPLDERLQLPPGKSSYLLQDWDQALVVDMPFETVSATLARILGFTQSVHTLERNQREMATAAEDFWRDRPTPPAQQEGQILVCTADGKGVPLRGGAKAPKGVEPPATGGVRPGTKKRPRGSEPSIRWTPSCAHPRRCWKPDFKTPPPARRRPRALDPATSTYGPPCSATRGIRPSRKFKPSSVGWPSRRGGATPTATSPSFCSWTGRSRCGKPVGTTCPRSSPRSPRSSILCTPSVTWAGSRTFVSPQRQRGCSRLCQSPSETPAPR